MHVGLAQIELLLASGDSLKGKRMVIRSVTQRIRNRFPNVAVAETATLDARDVATLGLACVSNDRRHANEMLDKVIRFVESERLDAEVGQVEIEIVHF